MIGVVAGAVAWKEKKGRRGTSICMHTSHLPVSEFRRRLELSASPEDFVGQLDVLMPGARLDEFRTLMQYQVSPGWLMRSLLGRYRNRILRDCGMDGPRLRTRYQPSGLGLVRISFRVEADLWVELRMLSLSARVSMSQIMVWLVHLEYRRWKLCQLRGRAYICWNRVGTPTKDRLTLVHDEGQGVLWLAAHFAASRPACPLAPREIKEMHFRYPVGPPDGPFH